eukprot:COSAG04_NODE_1870_length_5345_cov_9.554878_8_plen_180_part_00
MPLSTAQSAQLRVQASVCVHVGLGTGAVRCEITAAEEGGSIRGWVSVASSKGEQILAQQPAPPSPTAGAGAAEGLVLTVAESECPLGAYKCLRSVKEVLFCIGKIQIIFTILRKGSAAQVVPGPRGGGDGLGQGRAARPERADRAAGDVRAAGRAGALPLRRRMDQRPNTLRSAHFERR